MPNFVVILVKTIGSNQTYKKVRLFASNMIEAKHIAERDNVGFSAFSVSSQQ